MVTTINYSTSAHSANVNLTKYKTWGLTSKLMVTYPRRCPRHTFGHTDLVTASKIFIQTPAVIYKFTYFLLYLHPPFWHSPGSPALSPPTFYGSALSPCPLRDNTALVSQTLSCALCWRKSDKSGGDGGKSNLFLLKTEHVVQQRSPARCCSGRSGCMHKSATFVLQTQP